MADEGPLVDKRLAREARAADQCMRLGAVVLRPGRSRAGLPLALLSRRNGPRLQRSSRPLLSEATRQPSQGRQVQMQPYLVEVRT